MRISSLAFLTVALISTPAASWHAIAAANGSGTPIPDFTSLDQPWARNSLDFFPPQSGLGPVTYDKAHPVMQVNPDANGVPRRGPLHLGDPSNPNLKPWVA